MCLLEQKRLILYFLIIDPYYFLVLRVTAACWYKTSYSKYEVCTVCHHRPVSCPYLSPGPCHTLFLISSICHPSSCLHDPPPPPPHRLPCRRRCPLERRGGRSPRSALLRAASMTGAKASCTGLRRKEPTMHASCSTTSSFRCSNLWEAGRLTAGRVENLYID